MKTDSDVTPSHVCGDALKSAYHLDCEEVVLVAVLHRVEYLDEVVRKITPEHFVDFWCREIFRASVAVRDEHPECSDPQVKWSHFFGDIRRKVEKIEDPDGRLIPYLADMMRFVDIASAHFDDLGELPWRRCVETMVDTLTKRRIAALGAALSRKPDSDGISELVAILETSNVENRQSLDARGVIDAAIAEIDSRAPKPILVNVEMVDSIIGGLSPTSLNIIGARPGGGKTTFGIHIFRRFLLAGGSAAFFSLEMTSGEIAVIMAAQQTGVDHDRMRSRRMTETDFAKVFDAASLFQEMKMRLEVQPGLTVESFASSVQRLKDRGINLVILDYLQLLGTSRVFKSRYESIAHISGLLKQTAMKVGVPIIALCQLNREIEKVGIKRRWPMMSDIRDSGTIEQDADTIGFLAFDPNKDLPPHGSDNVELSIVWAKNRSGKTGIASARWIKSTRQILESESSFGDSF